MTSKDGCHFTALFAASLGLTGLLLTGAVSAQPATCGPEIVRTDALDAPSEHAWNLFLYLMHPAMPMESARGEADCSKPFGAPGETSVFETWRLARTEVFLDDGSEPPAWEDLSLPFGFLGATPGDPSTSPAHAQRLPSNGARDDGSVVLFDPEEGQSIFVDSGGIGETRMNRETYDFIRENCLWSNEGLRRYAQAVSDGKKPPIKLPVESIETKAVWLEFTEDALAAGAGDKYYSIVHEGKTYGLTSFHILTKDVPNWFWATFHHLDAPENEFELPDDFGPPAAVNGTVWENYILGGTQVDFSGPTGKPVILSDHYIEFGFQRSSCITCHSMAHGSSDGVNGRDFVDPDGPRQTLSVGTPDPLLFSGGSGRNYFQTDFLWSIPFRARNETVEAPQRCQF